MSIDTYPPQDQVVTLPTVRTDQLAVAAIVFGTAAPAPFYYWGPTGSTMMRTYFRIPEYYAGGDLTFRFLRRASVTGNTVKMVYYTARSRNNGPIVNIESAIALDFAPVDTDTHEALFVVAAAQCTVGDTIEASLSRLGDDAGDTNTGNVANWAASVTYNSWQYAAPSAALPLPLSKGGTEATTAAQARTNLGLGTLAQQNANAVTITGGEATGLSRLFVTGTSSVRLNVEGQGFICRDYTPPASDPVAFYGRIVDGVNRYNCYMDGTAPNYFLGNTGLGGLPNALNKLRITWDKSTQNGISLIQTGTDVSGLVAMGFFNVAVASVGSITTTATATAYNTTSDVRLKSAIEKLVGSLDVIRVLNPISFLWKANDEHGEGFAAHELQQVLPYAVTGEPDALNDDGSIHPQGVDYSKLVPRLVGAIQELLARVEALEARLA